MIDSGATGNFITPEFLREKQIQSQQKKKPYQLMVVDGTPIKTQSGEGVVDRETRPVKLSLAKHQEVIQFDIVEMANHDIILGIPWLRKWNPDIDWKTGRIEFNRQRTAVSQEPRGKSQRKRARFLGTGQGQQKGMDQSEDPVRHELGVSPEPETRVEISAISRHKMGRILRKDPDSVSCIWWQQNESINDRVNWAPGTQMNSQKMDRGIQNEQQPHEEQRELSTTKNGASKRIEPHGAERSQLVRGTPQENEQKTTELQVPDEYSEFRHLFEEQQQETLPQHQEWDHEIVLEEGKKPKHGPIYRLSVSELEALKEYLDENLRKGFIQPSTSPAGYPILFVPKKDGKLRLCVDYRGLNAITVKNRYALPLISELQDRFQGAQWFTKLDIPGAYNKIRIKEGDEWKTAFRTRYGHYEYLVMPFGLTNAPATFQSFINTVLYEYLDQFVVVYLDDILIYTTGDLQEHWKQVKKVLQKLQQAGLSLKIEKCEFHKKEIEFLGSIITTTGIRMDPKKVTAIQEWPKPTTLKEVQAFLGIANYYRRFVKNFAKLAEPITRLLKKAQNFSWAQEQNTAFQNLKQQFEPGKILQMFNPEKRIIIETDASDKAIGACISQPNEKGKLQPIAFHSRKLTATECNYDIYDKELLAIVAALQEWRVYTEGAKYQVEVISDHKNLIYFTTTKRLNRRQVRWAEQLAAQNFRITYRKGAQNKIADVLSRPNEPMQQNTEHQILKYAEDGSMTYNQYLMTTQLPDRWMNEIVKETGQRQEETNWNEVLVNGLLPIPTRLQEEVIREHHDEPTSGHQGIERTAEKISRNYYIPRLRKKVEKYIRKCDICQRTKITNQKPKGELQPIAAPTKPWEEIAMDFIVKLPKSEGYDSILVIADRLTKYAYFLPWKEATSAEDLAKEVIKTVICHHGIPKKIITDRAKIFMSKFWQTFTRKMGTQHAASTAYHPQTNGQVERINRTLEQYLRCYLNYEQNNWAEYLPIAQIAINDAVTDTTGITPFYANYGYHPNIRNAELPVKEINDSAEKRVQKISQLHQQIRNDIDFMARRRAQYYNQRRQETPTLKEGDRAYLLRKNLRTTRPSDKLDFVKIGPFKIKKKLSDLNYELALPKEMKIHPVFHTSLLEPTNNEATKKQTGIELEEGEYEVEKILDKRVRRGKTEYLIKWKGYNENENSWEPISHLRKCL
jgi:transposase InsO family protein